ncbi:MAG: group II intron reverse transcriptase/maturase, partial [Ruminobacter sp.]|nr:group II intron reverse transcriptase/maturase [Ruminobacter sp.]
MAEAIGRVIANRGGAGVDGMKTGEITEYIQSHPYQISESVRNGTYRPKPIKRVYIPKDNGDKRPLGIPTVIDRFIQ